MAELQRLGLIQASPHYKAGKYLTLLYPSQAGEKRRRVHVGNDRQKVVEALALTERPKTHD